ncbi:MAG: RIP metalloprotease [Holosporales bacterium]|nr:RIP metalloprotease [Holosporales bacterium]
MFDRILDMAHAVVPFIIVLTIVVFIHEMGHFLIARYNGVHVTIFSIGYGPEICGWTDKRGTRWRISCIPFGGYVMMLGDADAASVKSSAEGVDAKDINQTLFAKSPLQRIMVAFGGPLVNLLFTILVFISIGVFEGIPDMKPEIQSVVAESVAQKCGLQKGDVLTGLDDDAISLVSDVKRLLEKHAGKDAVLHYKRGGNAYSTAVALYEKDGNTKIQLKLLGVGFAGDLVFTKASFGEAVLFSLQSCWVAAGSMISGIFKMITGKSDGAKVGGLLSIGDFAKKSMDGGLLAFLNFMAMLSFSLAILNLLPIPVLDGGNIMINFIELIRRKPLAPGTIGVIYTSGLVAVCGLMIFANWNDLVNYGVTKKVCALFKGICGLFR